MTPVTTAIDLWRIHAGRCSAGDARNVVSTMRRARRHVRPGKPFLHRRLRRASTRGLPSDADPGGAGRMGSDASRGVPRATTVGLPRAGYRAGTEHAPL